MADRPGERGRGAGAAGHERGPLGRASLAVAFALCVALVPSLPSEVDEARELASDHFVLLYSVGSGVDATTAEYAALVMDALEAAYQVLVVRDGFPVPEEPIEVHLVAKEGSELGSEYTTTDAEGHPRPVIEIALESAMDEAAGEAIVPISFEDEVKSTAAHELFHVIQDTLTFQGQNDMSDLAFVESLATWAQEEAAPEADDYLEAALDFLVAPDSLGFFHRTYGAAIFWVFVASRHGGAEAIRTVMQATSGFDGRYAIEAAFQGRGLSFLDLWEAFSVALATETIPDAGKIRALFPLPDPQAKSQHVRRWVELPPPVCHGTWNGGEAAIERVTVAGETPYAPKFEQDPVGSPLRVAHAYGIDVLHLIAGVGERLEITFSGDPGTEFRVNVAARKGTEVVTWRLAPGTPLLVDQPNAFDEIRLVVTRGEAGTGTYHLTLRSG
jgi:hypothetical protein